MRSYADFTHKRIFLLSNSGAIPSLYVRFADPIGLVTHNYNLASQYSSGAQALVDQADLIILHRWFERSTLDAALAAQQRGVPIIYEADDNLLDLSPKTGLMLDIGKREAISHAIRVADLVICSTESLADAFRPLNPRIRVIKNYGLSKHSANMDAPPHLAVVNTDYFKLSESKADFFAALDHAVTELGYRISFFGSTDANMLALSHRHQQRVQIFEGFVDDRSIFLDRLLEHKINVAAVPLEESRQHTYKSDIKFLDFASIGVPGIYNNTSVYSEVSHLSDGYMCVDDAAGWIRGLRYFADADERRRVGLSAKAAVDSGRSIQDYARQYGQCCADLLQVGFSGVLGEDEPVIKQAANRGASGEPALFWDRRHLYVMVGGRKRHVITQDVIPQLLAAGLTFVDPDADSRRSMLEGLPLSDHRDLAALGHGALPKVVSRSTPAPGRLRISWLVPGLIIGGGGHRNIIRCAYQLERLGHEVSLYFTDTSDSSVRIAQQVREHFYPFDGHISRLDSGVAGSDIVFVTHWSTVKYARPFSEKVGEIVYFVQDFEPSFYAMGSEYVMAESTYREGYYCITSGKWCEHFLREQYGAEADHFRFPVDTDVYFYEPDRNRRRRVLFFAKPEMARRCYELGVETLTHFHRARPDIEIAFFGSSHTVDSALPFPATRLGVLPGPRDLAELYGSSRVGMVFSTTNPSLVPYEMMACGLPVLDLGRSGNEINYDGRFDVARLADPSPAAMARELEEMIANDEELESRRRNGLAFAATFPDEQEIGVQIEALLLKRVARRPSDRRPPAGKPMSLSSGL